MHTYTSIQVIISLLDQKVIQLVAAEESEGGLRTLKAPPLVELERDAIIPPKIVTAAIRTFQQLSERHQLIIKLISPFDSFSIAMVHGLLAAKVPLLIELHTCMHACMHTHTHAHIHTYTRCLRRSSSRSPSYAQPLPLTPNP